MARGLKTPHAVRARLAALRALASRTADDLQGALLRNGFFPDRQAGAVAMAQATMAMEQDASAHAPLEFHEVSSLSSWFYLHPEKVCGEERATHFSQFPLEVVGTREDVERALQPAPLTDLERLAQETERILSEL